MEIIDTKVFVSYTDSDRELIQPLFNVLENKGYTVYTQYPVFLRTQSYVFKIMTRMSQVAKTGFYIFIFTQESINSGTVKMHLEYAISNEALIIPIVIGKFELPEDFQSLIGNRQQFPTEPTEEGFEKVLDKLDIVVKKQ